ncbi:MAG: ADP-ribosylglycohydrolase family protein [Pirellulaceae bacterium]
MLKQFHGCLLGQAIADSIGAAFEGCVRDDMESRFGDKHTMLKFAADAPRFYTDDTEMAIALAEYLLTHDQIEPNKLMAAFVKHHHAWRGYGRGAEVLLEAFRGDCDYEHLAQHLFPGGSWGNGAAMRSAPVGLRFHTDLDVVWRQAELSAWPTHRNELGIEGGQLIAVATSIALHVADVTPQTLADALLPFCKTTVFRKQLEALAELADESELKQFGNGIEAHESVVTALGCFALYPDDYTEAIATAIWQAGDTDTIAAMTGALSGARLGTDAISSELAERLEPNTSFLNELASLASRLCDVSL